MNKKTGEIGEKYAKKFLLKQKYKFITENYYSRFGEIDLIFLDNQELVFVEVKTRKNDFFGTAEEALTISKKRKIIKTLLYFLNSASKKQYSSWRIDLISVKLDYRNKIPEINHIKNI